MLLESDKKILYETEAGTHVHWKQYWWKGDDCVQNSLTNTRRDLNTISHYISKLVFLDARQPPPSPLPRIQQLFQATTFKIYFL